MNKIKKRRNSSDEKKENTKGTRERERERERDRERERERESKRKHASVGTVSFQSMLFVTCKGRKLIIHVSTTNVLGDGYY